MAVRIVKSFNLILQALGIKHADWFQPVSIKISPTLSAEACTAKQVQGVDFFDLITSTEDWKFYELSREGFVQRVESLLAYSMCSYSKSKLGDVEADAPTHFLRILGFCPPEQKASIKRESAQKVESLFQRKLESFRRWSGDRYPGFPPTVHWIRQTNGQTRVDSLSPLSGFSGPSVNIDTETVFCMQYSAIGYKDRGWVALRPACS
jgi:hypothetical protein